MRGSEWLRIAARLEKEARRIKYGNVGVSVQIHKGNVCKIRFTRQECEAFPVDGEGEEEDVPLLRSSCPELAGGNHL